MEYKKSIINLIKERTSTRTYDGRALDKDHLDKLNAFLDEINKETNIKSRFKIISNIGTGKEESKKLGTYGFIQGASTYIIGIMDKDDNNALEFGYVFEKIILFATDLGIQTCWLGGTFSKDNFAELADLNENEFIAIISPVGYKKEKMRTFETTLRATIGADKRKPWNELFFNKSMSPLDEDEAGEKGAVSLYAALGDRCKLAALPKGSGDLNDFMTAGGDVAKWLRMEVDYWRE